MNKYKLDQDPALVEIQKIARGADTHRTDGNPLAAALEKIAEGFSLFCQDDFEVHAKEFPLYDAMYAYFRNQLK